MCKKIVINGEKENKSKSEEVVKQSNILSVRYLHGSVRYMCIYMKENSERFT